jgi:DnaJ-class molecular chaperone
MLKGSRVFRDSKGFTRAGSAGGFRGFGGIDDILRDMLGGAAGRGAGMRFEAEDIGGAAAGHDVNVSLTVTLEDIAKGAARRVRLPTGKEVEVKIPKGLADGQQIRLKGQGLIGPGGPGDALITVTVAPHRLFTREGANLRLDLPITLYEAVLGGKVRVPTLDGAVELAIPPGTSSGRTFRLKGKGLPMKTAAGDLLVSVRIVLPEGGGAELEALMRTWRESRPYDPRKDIG